MNSFKSPLNLYSVTYFFGIILLKKNHKMLWGKSYLNSNVAEKASNAKGFGQLNKDTANRKLDN